MTNIRIQKIQLTTFKVRKPVKTRQLVEATKIYCDCAYSGYVIFYEPLLVIYQHDDVVAKTNMVSRDRSWPLLLFLNGELVLSAKKITFALFDNNGIRLTL